MGSRSGRILVPLFVGACLAAAATQASATAPAGGTTYDYTLNATASDTKCAFFVHAESCIIASTTLSQPANVGDKYNIQINLDHRVVVPASKTFDEVYIFLADSGAIWGAPGPTYVSLSSLTPNGYQGPAYPFGPYPTDEAGGGSGYYAIAGFCCGYQLPNNGFSFTGLTATLDMQTADPNPLVGMYATWWSGLAATPQVISGIEGGTPNAPVILPPGSIGSISASISGGGSPTDFYGFDWRGGLFQTTAAVTGADPRATFDYELLDSSHNVIDDLTLDAANGFSDLMSLDLNRGQYIIGLATTSAYDPQYTLTFNTPLGVPEPSSWAMMLLGAGALGASIRKHRRTVRAA